MLKKIVWKDRAKAELRAIEHGTAMRILHALARIVATGEGDVKRHQDIEPPEFRLRVGDYRVRFREVDDLIEILSVKHRREAYRRTEYSGTSSNKKSPAFRRGFVGQECPTHIVPARS
jgi:mRNA interferase RelE/StbE